MSSRNFSNNKSPGFVVPVNSSRRINKVNQHENKSYNVAFSRGASAIDFGRTFSKGLLSPELNFNFQLNMGNNSSNFSNSKSSSDKSGGNGKPPGRGRDSRHGKNSRRYDYYVPRNSNSLDWSPGLYSGTISNSRVLGDVTQSPLFILSGQLLPNKTINNSYVQSLFDSSLYNSYYRIVCAKVNVSSARVFSRDLFYDYFNVIGKALQLYYTIDSVLTFSENYGNSNTGMSLIRDRIDSKTLSDFQRLQLTLEQLPCPGRYLDFIRYFCQNFAFSDLDNSPIYRLSYNGLFYFSDDVCLDGSIESNVIQETIDSLNDDKFSEFICVYSNAFPRHNIKVMPPSSNEVIISSAFRTFWHNSNCAYYDKILQYTSVVDNINENFYYASFMNELDGAVFAMGSTLFKGHCEPGFFKPYSNFTNLDPQDCTSLLRIFDGKFVGCSDDSIASSAGMFAVPILVDNDLESGFSVGSFPESGSRVLSSVDIESQQASATEYVKYLFDPNLVD